MDRVDFLRRALTVDRQLVGISGRVAFFGPPKNSAASVRVIPLPTVIVDGLAAHLAAFPSDTLVFMNESGDMIRRSNFGTMWRRVTKSVTLEGLHFHDLRHYSASLLIRHGESVKTLQARLGHANAAETLGTYSHLWPALTTAPARRWIWFWLIFLRTLCGLMPVTDDKPAGQGPKIG